MVLELEMEKSFKDMESLLLNNLMYVIVVPIPKQDVADKWKWKVASNGIYSTKKAYELLIRMKSDLSNMDMEAFSLIWNKIALPKVRVHAL
ncbi:hypothetical protein ACS0TY_002590 [Phlomoides rotata]